MASLGFLTLDLIIFIVIIAGVFFWSSGKGKKNIFRFITLTYPAILIFQNFPFFTPQSAMVRLGLYAGIFVILFITLGKNIICERTFGNAKFLDATLLSLSFILLVLTLHNHVLNLEDLYSLTIPYISTYFIQIPLGVLYILPVAVLMIVRRK